jgi:diacylglycerol kinase family enzyme
MATTLSDNSQATAGRATRRLALVLNDQAGAVLAGTATPDAVRSILRDGGAEVFEPPSGKLPDRLRAAAAGADTVVVAGGDGTVACAAAVLADSGKKLGILPCGTMNLLARDLALPVDDTAAAARVVLAGITKTIDVGAVRGGDADSHTFLCACMLGGPVRLGRHREQARRHGRFGQWMQFARAAVLVLRRPRSLRLTMTVDGVPHSLRTRSLTITLGALADSTGRMFGRASLDEGVLWAYGVRRAGIFGLLRVFWRLARGRPRDPALAVFAGRDITLDAPGGRLHIMIDGEVQLLATPIHLTVRPRSLTVLVPAAASVTAGVTA